MSRRSRLASLLILAGAVVVACAKPPAPAPAPAPAAAPTVDSSRIRDSLANAKRMADSVSAEHERQAAAVAAARSALVAKVFFDYDKSDITDQGKAILDAKVPILNANTGIRIRVEGNCDRRGSDEYNLALGQRRAAAAKRYLTDHGIDAARIDIISYGAERPVAEGDAEDAYSQNRRDEFAIVAGGDNLKVAGQ
ncbi:MAG: OmpA family protein [Gemmatimonadales bacterium]|jgi:peptidoglycan-associated lipoprotein